jgi:hypothetical protein
VVSSHQVARGVLHLLQMVCGVRLVGRICPHSMQCMVEGRVRCVGGLCCACLRLFCFGVGGFFGEVCDVVFGSDSRKGSSIASQRCQSSPQKNMVTFLL